MAQHLRIVPSAFAASALLLLVQPGCERARYIESGSPEGIISVGEVDIQDITRASSGMLESLLETGVLKTAKNKPAEMVIDYVVNDTSSHFSIDELTYRMREQLVNSGQAAVVTTYGQTPEDKTAQDLLRRQAFLKGERATDVPDPDFSLSGKITYTFRLTLTNIRTGLEAWTKTVSMTKVGNKPAVGF
jgi:PBP1b-binding outer membrane lipoprotein LpoB